MLPRYGLDSVGIRYYNNETWAYALVALYTGLDFLQIESLNYIRFLSWKRDAYIYQLEQTETGREYLHNAWRMTQTKPDRVALRRMKRKESMNVK